MMKTRSHLNILSFVLKRVKNCLLGKSLPKSEKSFWRVGSAVSRRYLFSFLFILVETSSMVEEMRWLS